MSGIGYREIAQFLAGAIDLRDRGRLFKHATHQYASAR